MTTTRRDILASAAASAAALALPLTTRADTSSDITARASTFVTALDDASRAAAVFPWDGAQWRRWDYFGATGYIKPGLRLEQMTPVEKDHVWDMFAAVLSERGLTKARDVMLLQDILMAEGDGVGQRHRERFSVSIHGEPKPRGTWGLRLEGHHLSLSFAVRDNTVFAVTPAAFAARPARVTTGPHAGLRAIDAEEQMARRLFADLTPALQARARVEERKLFNILSTAGQERAHATKIGLAASDMTSAQRDLLMSLVEEYAVQPYRGPLADQQRARVRTGDTAAMHFAWYGPNIAEEGFGYRIIADGFVIELGSIDAAGQHLHPVYHDLATVLGQPA